MNNEQAGIAEISFMLKKDKKLVEHAVYMLEEKNIIEKVSNIKECNGCPFIGVCSLNTETLYRLKKNKED
ncbi:MAG: hypothetical protein SVK54_08060 [candidate division WOR-3 bacterium]|nr:hypothetical protein [candidate division WOR-3 bacterium]